MQRFIVRSLFFALLVIGVIGGICAWEIIAEVRAYHQEIKAPETASILLCGDSQLGNSVDPAVCSEFFNFSAHGRALDQSYMIMGDVLRANPGQFKTLVVDVSPAAATWPLDSPLEQMSFSGTYWLVHYLHPKENTRDLSRGFAVVRDNLVGRRLRHASRALRGKLQFRSSLFGHFTPSLSVNKIHNPPLYNGLLKQKAELTVGAEETTEDNLIFVFMERMLELARSENVELVLATSPWHRELVELCGEDKLSAFTGKLQAWADRRGIRYVNLLQADIPDEGWQDANHLNVTGAKVFTPMLLEALRK